MPNKHSAEEPSPDTLMDSQITCLMLHPVTWPNHGPHKELYLAEEGIGLVRSLDWEVAKGPLWRDKDEEQEKDKEIEDEDKSANDTQQLTTELEDPHHQTFTQRRMGLRFSHSRNVQQFKAEKIKDGDYVYGPDISGVFYVSTIGNH